MTICVADHNRPLQLQKLQKLMPHDCAIVAEQKGEDMELPTVHRPQGLQQGLQLDLEAHRRWNASVPSVGFLNSVDCIKIQKTQESDDKTVMYVLEVFLSLPTSRLPTSSCEPMDASSPRGHSCRPTFKAERSFSDFEELRQNPRGIAKLTSGTEKRKQILTTFINDFVIMGQRRAPKVGKRKCEAQGLVPAMLEAFLLDHASDC
ncbi:hypothetical protein JM18_004012 [Phytophthora kernoviae]|uniref:PX domain-containing protein n=1 Tax=Phytophthora kernoviae TaxID=325452 RepID=A0A921VA27_9STRA|nr:hypothetical protein JM18_004012 [Phytophthora kernoviae]